MLYTYVRGVIKVLPDQGQRVVLYTGGGDLLQGRRLSHYAYFYCTYEHDKLLKRNGSCS